MGSGWGVVGGWLGVVEGVVRGGLGEGEGGWGGALRVIGGLPGVTSL